jgi:hypothetical protein
MSIIGEYKCVNLNATLRIEKANDSTGQGSGVIMMGEATIPVEIHYHFKGNNGPETEFQFWRGAVESKYSFGAAGNSKDPFAKQGIMIAGGMAMAESTIGFSGFFDRVR